MRPDVTLIAPHPRAGAIHEGASGVASYTGNLARALAATGARVDVVAPAEPGEPAERREGGVTVRRPFARGPRALPDAARAAIRGGAPVVHLQHEVFLYGGPASVPGLVPALGALRAARRGPVVTLHQVVDPAGVDADFTAMHRVGVAPGLARRALGAVQEGVRRVAARTVVHEPAFARAVPGATVIPHGVESSAGAPDRAAARARLGLGDGFLALCFGFVAPYKGLEVALAAAPRLAGDAEIVVAGGEHPRLAAAGDPYLADLRRRHGDVVRFTGRVPDAEVAPWFTAADVALLLYPRPFSSSGALALALAHGTPFLLSEELREAIGAPAVTAVARDGDALAGRLRVLAADPVARADLAAACAAVGAGRGWDDVAAAHRHLYDEIAGRTA